MVEHNFFKVCMLTLSFVILAFVISTWVSGYYFDFRIAFNNFGVAIKDSPDFSINVIDDLKNAFAVISNGNPIGFNYSNGGVILQVVKVILNAIVYLVSLFSIPVELLVAFAKFFFQCLVMISFLLHALSDTIANSWVPFGEGGFISPIVMPYLS